MENEIYERINPTEIKRILPEEVLGIFKELNLTPVAGSFYTQDRTCACGMGAYYLKNKEGFDSIVKFTQHLFTFGYEHGYYKGFDGFDKSIIEKAEKSFIEDKEELDLYKLGYEDGLAARNLLIENGIKFKEEK